MASGQLPTDLIVVPIRGGSEPDGSIGPTLLELDGGEDLETERQPTERSKGVPGPQRRLARGIGPRGVAGGAVDHRLCFEPVCDIVRTAKPPMDLDPLAGSDRCLCVARRGP